MNVVTRTAPSPTGRFHLGTARTALFNYLYARQNGGKFIIRIEDTDKERSRPEYEAELLEGFAWLGLGADEIFRQSDRIARHSELLQKLVVEDKAYVSKEPSRIEEGKMVEIVRLRNPERTLTFHDEIRGDITINTAELDDFVIARSLTDPLFHFAVVADDMDMGVTHVLRGEDHIPNTPRQILIQEALGAPRPVYGHFPLILNEQRGKLSKRSGVTSVLDYRDEGILPEAMVNYLALVGWNPGDNREYFTLSELIETFSLERVHKSGAIWDRTKLHSVNQHWMRQLSDEDFLAHVMDIGDPSSDDGSPMSYDSDILRKAIPLLKERAQTFGEAREILSGELSCLFEAPALDRERLLAKELPDRPGLALSGLTAISQVIETLPDVLRADEVKAVIMPLADAEEAAGKGGRGAVLWPLRYALSGQERSPDPFTLVSILGKEEAISRIRTAIAILSE